MPRLFGTDGIRGIANVDLKPPIAYALGRATAHRLLDGKGAILVGQDTRRSGDMLVAAFTAGATSMGVDVHRMGVCPTPALAYATGALGYGAGIMVSASHNPAEDNGLKVLDGSGSKLDDEVEDELEALIWRSEELVGPTNALLGLAIDDTLAIDRYRAAPAGPGPPHAARTWRCSWTAPTARAARSRARSSSATGARVGVRFAEPDGVNINLAVWRHRPGRARRAGGGGGCGRRLRAGWRRGPMRRGGRAGPRRGRRPAAGHHRARPAGARPRWTPRRWS